DSFCLIASAETFIANAESADDLDGWSTKAEKNAAAVPGDDETTSRQNFRSPMSNRISFAARTTSGRSLVLAFGPIFAAWRTRESADLPTSLEIIASSCGLPRTRT